MITEIKENQFQEEVLNSDKPVVVDFYADWCGPCRAIKPILSKLAEERDDVKFVKVDIGRAQSLAVQYGVSSIPNVMVFNKGKKCDGIVGATNKNNYEELINHSIK